MIMCSDLLNPAFWGSFFWEILCSFSLGCSAATLGCAGGCRATAEAGTTEVQHGQRSAGWGKCERMPHFHMTLPHFSDPHATHTDELCLAGGAQKQAERGKQINH